MERFYTLVTYVGKAKIANATALQKKLELSKIVLGDSKGNYYEPTEQQTYLKNKVWEGEITDKFIDKDNPNWIVVQTVLPSQIGGFTIREAGIVDSEGDLIVIAKYPETYKPKFQDGSTKDITINLILEVSNAENVTLKVDPTIIFATKKDLDTVKESLEQNIINSINTLNENDQYARNDIMDIKLKLKEKLAVDFINKSGIGFYDTFENNDYIESLTATWNKSATTVDFGSPESQQPVYEAVDNSNEIELVGDKLNVGDKIKVGDKLITIEEVL